ncbi:MAG: GNAT family N-acetyltransferase [Pirellulales bacterium]|nr:GNAT family N-acetyltransferase [Pirellulales bacterium]
MSDKPFRVEPLRKQDRSSFNCGVDELNDYLRKQASQDVRRRYATCLVAIDKQTTKVVGYYTLAMSSIPVDGLPEDLQQKLPRYPLVPVARLDRLAVDQACQGQRLGAALLADAIARTVAADVAAYAIVVDAKDKKAEMFYEHFGFLKLARSPTSLFLPISEALKSLLAE